ncbi:MAG: hypothetical protein ACFCU3_02340 [Verrucomicrobiales bacterium]
MNKPIFKWWKVYDLLLLGLGLFLVVLLFRSGWPDSAWAITLREEAGKKPRLTEFITAGVWWSHLFALFVGFVLLVSRPFWICKPMRPHPEVAWHALAKWFWVSMLLITLCVAVTRGMRLPLSIYADEAQTARQSLLGRWENPRHTDGVPGAFEPHGWDAAWVASEANNHVAFTLMSRVFVDSWRAISGQERHEYSEVAFRLPAWFFGTLAIPLFMLVSGRLFGAPVGFGMGLLLLFHPWMLRYGSEGRGYGLMFFAIALAFFALLKIWSSGAWRWWWVYGFANFFLLASFVGALYVAIVVNAGLAILLLMGKLPGEPRVSLSRWAVVLLVAAVAFVYLYAPSVPPILDYLQEPRAQGVISLRWLINEWAFLTVGMPWVSQDEAIPTLLAVTHPETWWGPTWLATGLVGAVLSLIVVIGVIQAFRRGGSLGGLVSLSLLVAGGLAILQAHISGSLLHTWYIVYAVPGVMLLLALGCTILPKGLPTPAKAALVLVGASIYASLIFRYFEVVLTHSREQNREAAQMTVQEPEDWAGWFWSHATHYEPTIRVIFNAPQLVELAVEAARQERLLRVTYGHRSISLSSRPGRLLLVEDSGLFEHLGTLYGLEEAQFTNYVYELKSGLTEHEIREASQAFLEMDAGLDN